MELESAEYEASEQVDSSLDESTILGILTSELDNSLFGTVDTADLSNPLAYYLGLPNGTEVEGRSQITSTDVADTIEWIMPQVMESFTQNNEIVIFDPVHEGDEKQAELESEFAYEVLMKENDGFTILHEVAKDALMQRNGLIKIFVEETENTKTEEYTGVTIEQAVMLAMPEDVEVVATSSYIDYTVGEERHDVRIAKHSKKRKITVISVPPEQFRVNSDHNSINLSDARFTAHVFNKTVSELTEEGYDVSDVPSGQSNSSSDYRFSLQGENVIRDAVYGDKSLEQLTVFECYAHMDIDKDGIAEFVKVTCVGLDDAPSKIIDIEEVSEQPWVGATAILMSHKFQGLSVYDRIKELQDHKTALWRNIMDNIYLQNNQRLVVVKGQVDLDDLLVVRPGGIIRANRLDAVTPLQTAQLGQEPMGMLRYLDEVRAGRSGVTPEGNASPTKIGDNLGSEGYDRLMNAKEALVGLIVRVFAETCVKPLCVRIRDLACRHIDTVQDFKFRGQWEKTNPSQWQHRYKCTVRVGTGTGDKQAKLSAITQVISLQEKALSMPGQALVDDMAVFNAVDDFCKLSGLNGATRYFIDPNSEKGKQGKQLAQQQTQAQQEEQKQTAMLQQQFEAKIAEAETIKANARQSEVLLKTQIESMKYQLDRAKHELEETKAMLKSSEKSTELDLDNRRFLVDSAIRLAEIEASTNTEQDNNVQQNVGTLNGQY